MAPPEPAERFEARRIRMVERDIAARGVDDERVLAAMAAVPRERFVPADLVDEAYDDGPLPIGEGQTISQPYIVAAMAEAAEVGPGDRVLEVGAGSGYGAAVLGRLAADVVSIDRLEPLVALARRAIAELGIGNVHVVGGDGTLGWPEGAPYDAIIVTASGPSVPPTLLDQLADGGRLVMPVGLAIAGQQLIRVRRHGQDLVEEMLAPVQFVPLVGAEGWPTPR